MNLLNKLARRIKNCPDEVDKRNRNNLVLFSEGAFILSILIMVMSIFSPYYHSLLAPHAILFFYTAALYAVAKYCQQNKFKYIRALQYLVFAPLLIGGILMGTALDPNRPGVTIIIFLCILPLFMLDNPWKIIGYQLSFAALFVVCAHHYKPEAVFTSDMMYFPVYLAYIIGVNIYALMEKVAGVENYLLVCQTAEKDALTGLFNRAYGETKVNLLLQKRTPGAFGILDVDNFKFFNDHYGHQLGDQVLCVLAQSLQSIFRPSDIIWRLGGDEFVIFATGMVQEDICQQKFVELAKLLDQVNFPQVAGLHIGISVGVTLYSKKETNFDELYKISDAALYEAKHGGKGQLVIKNV